jgi:outer membrane protein TolC
VNERLEDLLTTAVRERARAYADLADANGTIRELQAQLRDARLDLALARELLAYHEVTPVEEAS